MNGRERFDRALSFQPVDRGFSHELGMWGQTIDVWHTEGWPRDEHIPELIRGSEFFGLDRIDYLPLRVVEMLPPFDEEVLSEDARYIIKRFADGHVSRGLKPGEAHGWRASMDQGIAWPVQGRADFEDVKQRYRADSPARYPQWWPDVCRGLQGRDYPLCLTQQGAFGLYSFLRRLMGTERSCILFYDDPALAEEMLDYLTEYLLELIHPALHDVEIDFFAHFEDFAYNGGPLIGPNIFRRFLLPRYRRVNDVLRAHGVRHIWLDSDGNTEVLLPLFIEAGITCHWPIERAAGMDPLKIRARYGHDLALVGGIDKRVLTQGRQAIEQELYRHVPQLLEDGGYIPTLDHWAPPDVHYDSFMTYLEIKRKLLGL